MAAKVINFLRQQCFSPANPKVSFSGKTIIITGANRGLGLEAALKIVALDASRVVLGVRDCVEGERSKNTIEQLTGRKGVMEVWKLDLESYESIQDFSHRASCLDRLDIVVLNAGVLMYKHTESPYGWEESLQINVLSTALLALLLLPVLKKTSQLSSENGQRPVLQFVSSGTYKHVVVADEDRHADNLLGYYSSRARDFDGNKQYALSKLFITYVMQTLASIERAGGEEDMVHVLAVCPGVCKSGLMRNSVGWRMWMIKTVASMTIMRTAEQGSRTLVSGTSLGEEAHGKFWQHDQIQHPFITGRLGEEFRKKVWTDVVEALGKDLRGLPEILDRAGALEAGS
ncbi:hypothetical protein PG999_001464 [Apiospora kogelbergensis]|uniref:Uncharacterized protein n=1 Tax=Apiospora kogelbergensis TaxID=1337665 RepID=A0AAW0REU6_9PEZI